MQPNGFYEPQYQIVGKTPEDTAKLCQIKDVRAFLDYSAPGARSSNAEGLADALGGIAVSDGAVEGLPKGAQLNVDDDNLGPQARQAITDTISRCKATRRDDRAPDAPANGDRPVPELIQPGAFGGAVVAPTAAGPNDPASLPPAFGTRNLVPAASSVPVGQMGDTNVEDWWKTAAPPASSNINPSSVRGLPSPMPGIHPDDDNASG